MRFAVGKNVRKSGLLDHLKGKGSWGLIAL